MERSGSVQFRGRVLRQGDPPLPQRRAGDLRDDADVRHRARERGRGPGNARDRSGLGGDHRKHPGLLPDPLHPQPHPGRHGRPSGAHSLPDLRRLRRHAAHRAPHAGAGDVPFPLRLHGQGGGHRARGHDAKGDLLGVLRGAVPAAPPPRLRRDARRPDRPARRPVLAGEHRLDGRASGHGPPHQPLTHSGDGPRRPVEPAGSRPHRARARLRPGGAAARARRRARRGLAATRHLGRFGGVRRAGEAARGAVPKKLRAVHGPGARRGGRGRPPGLTQLEVVRDPLWNNIRLEPEALAVVDTPAVQRLRYVRQLGHAFLVYPGATHTRFEHMLGAYHLARRALAQLEETGHRVDRAAAQHVTLAALLHDIGHYPFSHALEEAGLPHHEALAGRHLSEGELAAVLQRMGVDCRRLLALIQGESGDPLVGLVSGSLDVDKLDYLSRDAWMCGVPYGVIDVDRLLTSLTVASDPDGRRTLALHEKGLAALESLLFAKYQMYRNVYWHHAVRSATSMFKRLVRRAIASGRVRPDAVAVATDDGLIHELLQRDVTGLARSLRERRLAKRALDLPATELPADTPSWPSDDPDLLERVEDRLARDLRLAPGELDRKSTRLDSSHLVISYA